MSGILSAFIGRVAGVVTDAYFNLVTLLLPGNGTNGAQNNTFLDSSTNNFTITRNGNTTQGTFSPFSQTGWSNFFDGTDDYIAVADNAVLRPGASNFTLEAWVWRNASGAAHTIYAKGGASTGIVFQVTSTNVLRFTHTTTNIDSTGTIAANAWTHVAVVREGTSTNQTKLYINGTQDGQGTVSTDFTQTEEVRIGTDRSAAADFNGYISNLRFVKGTALYTGAFTPSTSPLTTTSQGATATEVELLTCQSNRFVDNSSNGFTLTITGTPSVQAFSPFAPTAEYSAATVGGSGYFDGTGDYLTTPSTAVFNVGTGNFTVETWIYPNAITANTLLFISFNTSNGIGVGFQATNAWGLVNSGVAWVFTTSTMPTVGQWNHLVVCRGGTGTNQTAIFLNGTRVATGTVTTSFSQTSAYGIGYDGANTAFNGYMSSLRVVTSDVYGFSNSTITVPTAPLTAITNTQLLLNYTNAGITDATAKNVLETVGNAQISTTQSKFGGSSMYFDGTGDYLIPNAGTTDLYAFGSGDFTVEMWIYQTGSGTFALYDTRPNNTNGAYLNISSTSGQLEVYVSSSSILLAGTISLNTWTHIAVSRSGTNLRGFINGAQVGSTVTNSTVFLGSAQRPVIGASGFNVTQFNFNGYIDDLRVTRGHARYTSNFTAPTAAFPLQ